MHFWPRKNPAAAKLGRSSRVRRSGGSTRYPQLRVCIESRIRSEIEPKSTTQRTEQRMIFLTGKLVPLHIDIHSILTGSLPEGLSACSSLSFLRMTEIMTSSKRSDKYKVTYNTYESQFELGHETAKRNQPTKIHKPKPI
jgi:hypothetical protein